MKKNILLSALAALTITSASAETIIITGSTAFRSTANQSLYALFGAPVASDKSTTNAIDAGNLLWTNVAIPGASGLHDVIVGWNGSDSGIQTVASPSTNPATFPFYDKAKITASGSFPKLSLAGGNMTTGATNANSSLQKGTIVFSDTQQGVSQFQNTVGTGANKRTYSAITANMTKIGVIPFAFVTSKNSPITDINPSVANTLFAQGYTTLNFFPGQSSGATNTLVWAPGRNPDSGTRITTLAVTKWGYNNPVLNIKPTAASGVITAIGKPTTATLNGQTFSTQNNGESSGGTLVGYCTNTINTNATVYTGGPTGTNHFLVTYAGVSDICDKYADGARALSYCGVAGRAAGGADKTVKDAGYTNIITGKYPFWSYEWIGYNSDITATATIASALKTELVTRISSYESDSVELAPNIKLSDMAVNRTADGGPLANGQ
jgi:hypothetical protein